MSNDEIREIILKTSSENLEIILFQAISWNEKNLKEMIIIHLSIVQ